MKENWCSKDLSEHEELKRTHLLLPSHRLLSQANCILEMLSRMSSQGGTGVGQSNRVPALPSTPATASSPAGQLATDSFSTSTGFGVSS
ncbi:unnamed protein product, partial [Protopolystoma xenopodis]